MLKFHYYALIFFQLMACTQTLNVNIHCRLIDFTQQSEISIPLSASAAAFDISSVENLCSDVQVLWRNDKFSSFSPVDNLVGLPITEGMHLDFIADNKFSDNQPGTVAGLIRSARRDSDVIDKLNQIIEQNAADKKIAEADKKISDQNFEDFKKKTDQNTALFEKRFEKLYFADAERGMCQVFDLLYQFIMDELKHTDSAKYNNYKSLSDVLQDSNHHTADLILAFSIVANIDHAVATRTWDAIKTIKQARNRRQHEKIRSKKLALESLDNFFQRWTTTATSQSEKDELKAALEGFIIHIYSHTLNGDKISAFLW